MSQKASLMFVGILSLIGGILALVYPGIASLTAELMAAWTFVLVGVLQIFAAFRSETSSKFWVLLGGVLALAIGVMMINKPLIGLASLTLLVASAFMVSGIIKLIAAWPLRQTPLFWPLLISGAVSVLLAGMIFSNFPMSAVSVLGILLGVELLSNGIALMTLSRRDS